MIDFTSSLYLGMKHGSAELKTWQQLTAGVPAALYEHDLSKQVGTYVAHMQGLEAGISATSTLHLYWDLFGLLSDKQTVLFIDEKVYPVSKYGIEKLIVKKIPIHTFNHLEANHLAELVKKKLRKFKTPVVITDGWCPQCAKHAPINEYLKIIKPYNGNVVLDDTQAFGILGENKSKIIPYGFGGGGILKWLNVHDSNIISITSLAKGFGVPMAVISSNTSFITSFKERSETRVNSSPVSIAHLTAAINAFRINTGSGEQRRAKLWSNISLLKTELRKSGIKLNGSIFPVQSICDTDAQKMMHLYKKLKKEKIKTVLVAPHKEHKPLLTMVMRCDHTIEEIKYLAYCVQKFNLSFSKNTFMYANAVR